MDHVLVTYLTAPDEEDRQRHLDELLTVRAAPLIRQVLRRRLGFYVILQQQQLIADLEEEHAQLQDKITERAAKYGLRLQDMENFAFLIMAATDGWLSLQETKDQIERTLTDVIINAHPQQR